MLDYLFETANGEFVVVEAKAAKSQLGWTKGRVLMIEPGGGAYFLEIPGDVQQFSPTWFEQRLAEMRGPKGDPASRRLAAELEASWRTGKIRALVIRAPEGARTAEVALEILDHSDEWNAHRGVTANHTIPKGSEVGSVVNGAPVKTGVTEQRPPVERMLKIHQSDETRLKKELDRLDTERGKANSELNRAKGRLKTAEKNKLAADQKPRTWQTTKDKLEAKVTAEKAEVTRLETRAKDANQAVDDIKQKLVEVRQKIREVGAEVRKLRASTAAQPVPSAAAQAGIVAGPKASRATDLDAGRAAATADPGTKAGELVEARANTARATEGAVDATKARAIEGGRPVRELAAGAADVAKVGKLARVLSLTKTIGKVAVGLFIPLTKLEILLELALWLYDWDQRRRKADEREWRRIYAFLFESAAPIADPFAGQYQPAIGGWIWDTMNARLNNERDPQNFVQWVREWDRNRKWLGFVYVGVAGGLTRQEHVPRISSADKAPHPIRYWAGEMKFDFKTWSKEDNRSKKEGPTRELGPEHPDNLFTLGEFGDPFKKPENKDMTRWAAANQSRSDYLYRDVEERRMSISVTSPTPILTPFDYLSFKCKDLMVEILRFISRFDEYFQIMAPFSRETFFTKYWYEGGTFPDPIDSDSAHYCLKKLYALITALEAHTPQQKETAQAGLERRRQIIADIVRPNRTSNDLSDIDKRLYRLARDLNYTSYRPVQDPDLAYLTNEHLSALTSDILGDARRIYADITSGKDSPRSLEYRYIGSKSS
ncbi:hypothetical protein FHR70_003888 [Microvirga lupini]|uniref:Uncharacterized protein n=1 Tax=Microvirga lupini TaxID=420324 RepID=A0A7W4VP66_9HYPH|nr:hypothetical protein [Microvirga lupini]MBB3020800.1 hypothetical protein [Microvirga lupini]